MNFCIDVVGFKKQLNLCQFDSAKQFEAKVCPFEAWHT